MNKSTARKFKSEYLRELELSREKSRVEGKEFSIPTTLPTKHQGRPLLLGKELDQKVQEFITTTRANKGVTNTMIVMGAAEGSITAHDPAMLSVNGGHIQITKAWAKSLFKRMHYVK